MTVADRVHDARILAQSGRADGALMVMLLAVQGASAARFPGNDKTNPEYQLERALAKAEKRNPVGFDFWRFKNYLNPQLMYLLFGNTNLASSPFGTTFQDKPIDIAEVLYKHYRNELVHESKLPHYVTWDPSSTSQQGYNVTFGNGSQPDTLVLKGDWLALLAHAATVVPPVQIARQSWWTLKTAEGVSKERIEEAAAEPFYGNPMRAELFLNTAAAALTNFPSDPTDDDLHSAYRIAAKNAIYQDWIWGDMQESGFIQFRERLGPKGVSLVRDILAMLKKSDM